MFLITIDGSTVINLNNFQSFKPVAFRGDVVLKAELTFVSGEKVELIDEPLQVVMSLLSAVITQQNAIVEKQSSMLVNPNNQSKPWKNGWKK